MPNNRLRLVEHGRGDPDPAAVPDILPAGDEDAAVAQERRGVVPAPLASVRASPVCSSLQPTPRGTS